MDTKDAAAREISDITNSLEGLKLIVYASGAKINLASASALIGSARLVLGENLPQAISLIAEARSYLDAAMEIHNRCGKSGD